MQEKKVISLHSSSFHHKHTVVEPDVLNSKNTFWRNKTISGLIIDYLLILKVKKRGQNSIGNQIALLDMRVTLVKIFFVGKN